MNLEYGDSLPLSRSAGLPPRERLRQTGNEFPHSKKATLPTGVPIMNGDPVLGIDLGTTNSVVAIVRDGAPQVLGEGEDRLLPSVVGLDPQGNLLVGAAARSRNTRRRKSRP
jgi:hypothetical protein